MPTLLKGVSDQDMDAPAPLGTLSVGFLVRVPVEDGRGDDESREFRIGRVVGERDELGGIEVELVEEAIGEAPRLRRVRCSAAVAGRCRVLPGAPFWHVETKATGRVLSTAEDGWPEGAALSYYVLADGRVTCVPETALRVGSTSQDPDPAEQLRRYELHHPSWRASRDQVVETLGSLRSATFGLDELVGSRVALLAHQAEVVAKVLASTEVRSVLADEVGLGKTIEAGVILKGLRRRDPALRVLIVAPASLVHQWQRELDDRFWLRFRRVDADGIQDLDHADRRGLIVAAETLAGDGSLQLELRSRQWGLLVVDEAHQVRKDAELAATLVELSRAAERVLILSATPVQRRREEYVALLQLLDPNRYERVTEGEFAAILDAQDEIRRRVAYLARGLEPDLFDPEEVVEDLGGLAERLEGDGVLPSLVEAVRAEAGMPDRGLAAAREALAYVSENYRIEGRVIRNRRAHLDVPVPTRGLDASFAYEPSPEERATLEALLDYLGSVPTARVPAPVAAEVTRLFLGAAASSAAALLQLVETRRVALGTRVTAPHGGWDALAAPATARRERARVDALLGAYPAGDDRAALDRVRFLAERWRETEERGLEVALARRAGRVFPTDGRLGRTLAAVASILGDARSGKALVFSAWPETLDSLARVMDAVAGPRGTAVFRAGMGEQELQHAVDRFQADPDCRVLLTDELGGEGRNFQHADGMVHVDLPWTPALIEQRIGRVDRIGRSGVVRSVVITTLGTPEAQMLAIWQEAFGLFTASMSGMEIALEGIQDEIGAAVGADPRAGLAELLPAMRERARTLRDEVEEERYFDEGVIDRRLRDDVRATSEAYRDETAMARAVRSWASIAGLWSKDLGGEIVAYSPRSFGEASMSNAKVVSLPNMEEALRRSRTRNSLEVRGTFNRDVAVRREDLVFFAPGSDPWTGFVIDNAARADRGRCCAILRLDSSVVWTGLDLLFAVELDPRPLLALGRDPAQLVAGQGYLRPPTYRVLVSHEGRIEGPSTEVAATVRDGWHKSGRFKHLGERKGERSNLDMFRSVFPPERWPAMVDRLEAVARAHLAEEYAFLDEAADEAEAAFAERAQGWRAASRWFRAAARAEAEIAAYEEVSEAIVAGVRRPRIRLESVCCWLLRPAGGGR